MTYPRSDEDFSIVVLCALLGVVWLGWVVVLALIVVRMVVDGGEAEGCRILGEAERVRALGGGPLDGLEFELHA